MRSGRYSMNLTTPTTGEPRYCGQCGKPRAVSSHFCIYCGSPLAEHGDGAPWQTADPPPSRVDDFDPMVRLSVAVDPTTPVSALQTLARDEWPLVRWGVAVNSACPPDVLMRLARDSDREVRNAALANANCPWPELPALADADPLSSSESSPSEASPLPAGRTPGSPDAEGPTRGKPKAPRLRVRCPRCRTVATVRSGRNTVRCSGCSALLRRPGTKITSPRGRGEQATPRSESTQEQPAKRKPSASTRRGSKASSAAAAPVHASSATPAAEPVRRALPYPGHVAAAVRLRRIWLPELVSVADSAAPGCSLQFEQAYAVIEEPGLLVVRAPFLRGFGITGQAMSRVLQEAVTARTSLALAVKVLTQVRARPAPSVSSDGEVNRAGDPPPEMWPEFVAKAWRSMSARKPELVQAAATLTATGLSQQLLWLACPPSRFKALVGNKPLLHALSQASVDSGGTRTVVYPDNDPLAVQGWGVPD